MNAAVETMPPAEGQRPIRYITLPNGRRALLAAYCYSWRQMKQAEPDKPIRGFDLFAMPAADILREIRRGVHDRINRHIPGYGVGRKWDDDWQRDALHTARRVNTPRLIVRETEVHPVELRPRLAHRITAWEDAA